MEQVRLGDGGPWVSRVGFGAWAIGGLNWGRQPERDSREALTAALDAGVTFIDTADVYGYGRSKELVGDVLRETGRRDVVVATKAGNDFYIAGPEDETIYGRIRLNGRRDYLVCAAEQSLRRLGVETLDVLQLHSLNTADLESDEPWEALALLKRQGKIRYAGWSVKSFQETGQSRFLERGREVLDCIQVRYNLLERGAEEELFPKAAALGLGVVVRIPLLFGLLTGKYRRGHRFPQEDHRSANLAPPKLEEYLQRLERLGGWFASFPGHSMAELSLRFCLSHPACHTVIPGARNAAQAKANTAVARLGPLPPGQLPPLV